MFTAAFFDLKPQPDGIALDGKERNSRYGRGQLGVKLRWSGRDMLHENRCERTSCSAAVGRFTHVLVALVIAASASPASAQPSVTGSKQEAAEVFRAASQSVVVVHAVDPSGRDRILGSGVVVAQGFVATNAHVIKAASAVSISQHSKTWAAVVVASDPDRDVALLRVDDLTLPVPRIGSVWEIAVGNKIYAIGAPQGLEASLSDGLVSGLRGTGPDTVIQITAAISPGSSGGGVFDDRGRLIGLSTLMLTGGQNLNFAVPIDWVLRLQPKSASSPAGEDSDDLDAILVVRRPSWRGTLAELQALFPGGFVERFTSGEVVYRVVRRGFGHPLALVTFCVRPNYGLATILVEFADPRAPLDLRKGAYTRTQVETATRVHETLVRRATAKHGPPTSARGTPASGSTFVWKQGKEDFVRLTSRPIDGGRVHLVLYICDQHSDGPEPTEEKNIDGGLWTTPPSTWSNDGALSLKWGMGPGDVIAVYPDLRSTWSEIGDPTPAYFRSLSLGGDVGAYFYFFKGRLVSIDASPFFATTRERPSDDEEKARAYQKHCIEWRETILALMTKQYGAPFDAPAETSESSQENGSGRRDIHWAWRDRQTGILLDHSLPGLPSLEYLEIATYEEVAKAKSEYQLTREQDWKRSNLSWVEPPVPGSPVSQTKGPPNERLKKIERSKWSRAGWLGFRWGMGKGDVAHVADAAGEPFSGGAYRSNEGNLLRSGKVLGSPSMVVFYFGAQGALNEIVVSAYGDSAATADGGPEAVTREWFKNATTRMTKDYGTPECTDSKCSWSRAGRVSASLTMKVDGKFSRAELDLKDPGPIPAAKTKRYWSKCGWETLRIGMTAEDLTDAFGGIFPEPASGALPSQDEDGFVRVAWPDESFGLRLDVSLFFKGGRVENISVTDARSSAAVGKTAVAARERWFREVKKDLSKRYGAGSCSKKPDGGEVCSWDKQGIIRAGLLLTINKAAGAGAKGVGLFVDDPGPEPPAPADPKLVAQRTSSKTWKGGGWQDLRFGMGIGDVLPRLISKTGGIRAAKPAACTVSSAWEHVIECRIEEKSHSLEINGRHPSLSFLFLEGRLFAADLVFYGYDSMEQASREYGELAALLQSRYGRADPGSRITIAVTQKEFTYGSASWRGPSLKVSLTATIVPHSRSMVMVQYWDSDVEGSGKLRSPAAGDGEKL